MDLILAWHFNDESQIESLLKEGTDPNYQNLIGDTLLHKASKKGNLDVVKILLKYKAHVNIQNNCGDTPLHEASYANRMEVVDYLLSSGANYTIQNKNGRTPKEIALYYGYNTTVYDKYTPFLINDTSSL